MEHDAQHDEVAPPGWSGTVVAMKEKHGDKISNPYALSWWMKKRKAKSHYKETPKKDTKTDKVPPKKKEHKKGKKKFCEWLEESHPDFKLG